MDVVEGQQQLQGANAGDTFIAKMGLASAMEETGQVAEAKALLEELLPKVAEGFAPESAMVLNTQQSLANILRRLEKYEAALELYNTIIEGQMKLNGRKHEHTLNARHCCAITCAELGYYSEARVEYEEVLRGYSALPHLGVRHPTTTNARHSLALLLYNNLGEPEEGLCLMQEVVDVWSTVLGEHHQWTQESARMLEEWRHAAALVVGTVVLWSRANDAIPEGTFGEVATVFENTRRVIRVKFPGSFQGTTVGFDLPIGDVILANSEEQQLMCAAGFDHELPAGTRISFSAHGAGSYVSFKRKRFGSNQHTILFDEGGQQQVVPLKGLRWSIVDGVLAGKDEIEST